MSEPHVCTPDSCPEGANYFVTCIDGDRVWYIAGPYKTHAGALGAVDLAKHIGTAHEPLSDFYSWGTVRSTRTAPGSITKAGLL